MKIKVISEKSRLINSIMDDIIKDVLEMDEEFRPDTVEFINVLNNAVQNEFIHCNGFDVTIYRDRTVKSCSPNGSFYRHYSIDRAEDDTYYYNVYVYEFDYKAECIYDDIMPCYNCVIDELINDMKATGSKKKFDVVVQEESMVIALAEMLKLKSMDYDAYDEKYAWICIDENGEVTTRFDDESFVVDEGYEVYYVVCDSDSNGFTIVRCVKE